MSFPIEHGYYDLVALVFELLVTYSTDSVSFDESQEPFVFRHVK